MSTVLLAALFESTLALTAAAVLVLALRHPLRHAFGARAAYALWLLLPCAALVALIPEPSPAYALPLTIAAPSIQSTAASGGGAASSSVAIALLALWLLGVLVAASIDIARQRRFVRALGALQPRRDGTLQSASDLAGPAVVGMWRARIVVPSDFEQRFSVEERALILAHERVHVSRRDLPANLLAAALRSAQWFNPVLHLAFARFRFDQELAADAVVLSRRPGAGRPYAEAMLKAQLSPAFSPLGCHWQSAHPLKERISMLKRPLPGLRRVVSGVLLACGLSLGFGYAAWAVQPVSRDDVENPPTYNSLKPPRYPQAAIDAKQEGDVVLRVLITAEGNVDQIEIESSTGSTELDEAAAAAVRKWHFNPGSNGYSPVSSWVLVPIKFSLTGSDKPFAPVEHEDALDTIQVRGD